MEVLAWFVIILFLLFVVGPFAAILCSRNAFIRYPEAVWFGFCLMCGAVSAIGMVATLYWAIGVVAR